MLPGFSARDCFGAVCAWTGGGSVKTLGASATVGRSPVKTRGALRGCCFAAMIEALAALVSVTGSGRGAWVVATGGEVFWAFSAGFASAGDPGGRSVLLPD